MLAYAFRFAILALSLAASPAQSEVIKNAAYRFTLNKPDGWQGLSAQQVGQHSVAVGNESKATIQQGARAIVVAFAKYKEPIDEVNSTFFMFGVKVGPAAQSVPPTRFVDVLMQKAAGAGASISIVSPTKATTVGGLPAAHARFNLDSTVGQRLHKSESDMWVIPRGDSLLVIQIQAKRGDKASGIGQLRSAVQSIRFER